MKLYYCTWNHYYYSSGDLLFHKDNLNKFDIKDTYQFNNLLDNSLNLKDKLVELKKVNSNDKN